jgi:predicted dehydrogenase
MGADGGRGLGIAVIGTGFMGKAHALGYRTASAAFPGIERPRLVAIADMDRAVAEAAARRFGFARGTGDWRDLLSDAAIDIISITTPNALHKEMVLAALASGKHVHCEKPLAPSLADAEAMRDAAEKAGLCTQVGYNYIKNPILKLAREMIEAGEIGAVTGFRGVHAEDYMTDAEAPWSWRLDPSGGPGAIADLGSHVIGMARFLVGPIVELTADVETVVRSRPATGGGRRAVEVDDSARLIVRFARGHAGVIEASWIAAGRKMQLAFEITGSRGSLVFTQERLNELQVFRMGADARLAGFTRIEAGPAHPPYGHFCVAPGHQLGFNDLKAIEMAEWLEGVARGVDAGPNFREAVEIQKVVEAAIRSSRERRWVKI